MRLTKRAKWGLGLLIVGFIALAGGFGVRELDFHRRAVRFSNSVIEALVRQHSSQLAEAIPCQRCRERLLSIWYRILVRAGEPRAFHFRRVGSVFMFGENESSMAVREVESEYDISFDRLKRLRITLHIGYDGAQFSVLGLAYEEGLKRYYYSLGQEIPPMVTLQSISKH